MLSLSELIQYVPGSACSIKCFQLAVPLLKKVRQNEISEEIYTSLHRKAESLAAIGVPGTHKCQDFSNQNRSNRVATAFIKFFFYFARRNGY